MSVSYHSKIPLRYIYIMTVLMYVCDSHGQSANEILERMLTTMQQENYRGDIIYDNGAELEALTVVHGIVDGREMEAVHHLNGPERVFYREGDSGDCASLLRGLWASKSIKDSSLLANSYIFRVVRRERIAGREGVVIQAVPKDTYRYGLSLSVDSESAMLLRSLILAENVILERMQFVSIDTDLALKAEDFAFAKSKADTSMPPPKCEQDLASKSPWRPTWIPSGFIRSAYKFSEDEGHVETYSDGLASFTVFSKTYSPQQVESKFGNIGVGFMKTVAQRGASVTLLSMIPVKNQVLAANLVGEIPAPVAHKILSSVSFFGEMNEVSQSP